MPTSAPTTGLPVSASETTTSRVTSLVVVGDAGDERRCSTRKVAQHRSTPPATSAATHATRIALGRLWGGMASSRISSMVRLWCARQGRDGDDARWVYLDSSR